ncbi:hypothetical protein [Streptomyces sp. NPDC049040]|uniref:hypothetical protein n=1 Tax=Streptomyces sp. NPDC049040 TaxID=3365593 RepID=UPI00371E0461
MLTEPGEVRVGIPHPGCHEFGGRAHNSISWHGFSGSASIVGHHANDDLPRGIRRREPDGVSAPTTVDGRS